MTAAVARADGRAEVELKSTELGVDELARTVWRASDARYLRIDRNGAEGMPAEVENILFGSGKHFVAWHTNGSGECSLHAVFDVPYAGELDSMPCPR